MLTSARMDWHDLASALVVPVKAAPKSNLGKIADDLGHARDRLAPRERAFLASATAFIAAGRTLTVKQEKWLHDLHLVYVGAF